MAAYKDSVSASAPSPVRQQGEGKLKGLSIDIAANGGFTVTCRHEPKPSRRGEIGMYIEPKEYVFADAEGMTKFITSQLGTAKGK